MLMLDSRSSLHNQQHSTLPRGTKARFPTHVPRQLPWQSPQTTTASCVCQSDHTQRLLDVIADKQSNRRQVLCTPGVVLLAWACTAAAEDSSLDINLLQAAAYEAYANRDFTSAVQKLTAIIKQDPDNPRWLEMRAQVLVDGKNFDAAIKDIDTAVSYTSTADPVPLARLYASRALAYEGLADWHRALEDYKQALDLAQQGGESPDPYIINSMGNCQNSLQDWEAARDSYLVSSQLFQQAKGFRGRGGTTTQRLDGAIYAASNAALMLAQLGDEQGALKEFERISRRAPGSSDTRAALAALYWRDGRVEEAENVWNFACENISAGCRSYQDTNWLSTVRRWPPKMVMYLQNFLALTREGSHSS